MPVGALIFGIISLVVFDWLGPVIGLLIAAGIAAPAAIQGQVTIVTWPVWSFGLGIGVGLPLIALVLGIIGMAKSADQKGVALAGLVMSGIGLLIGLVITAVLALGMDLADQAVGEDQATPAAQAAERPAPASPR